MNFKNYDYLTSLALILTVSVLLFSCGGGGKKDESAASEFSEAQQQVAHRASLTFNFHTYTNPTNDGNTVLITQIIKMGKTTN